MSEAARPAALLVHGAGGGGWEWNVWMRVFAAAGFDARAPDLAPGAAGLAATQLHDYAAQVGAALAGLARPRVVVGASLGGLLALMQGGAPDALVLVNPLPPAPWHAALTPAQDDAAIVPWRTNARLEGTRRALPDADDAARLYAFRRWRDESGAVLAQARAGVDVALPRCPALVIVSDADAEVPPAASLALAAALSASVLRLPAASHVGPLLGRDAATTAAQAVAWLNAALRVG